VTLYLDSSALIKRYVDEPDSDTAEAILLSDPDWVTAQISLVEVRLALHRRLDDDPRTAAVAAFERDWQRTFIVAVDEVPRSSVLRRVLAHWMPCTLRQRSVPAVATCHS
jgi:predicted nucleic acid-binding protein